MEGSSEIARLEQFVDNLLGKYKKLKEQHHALEVKLEERDSECEQLKATIEELRGERSEVGGRVAALLSRIEQWELEQESGADPVSVEQEGLQTSLFQEENTQ